MHRRLATAALTAVLAWTLARGAAPPAPTRLSEWAVAANDADAATSGPAIAHLRDAGPAGLAALMAADADAIRTHQSPRGFADDPAWARTAAALDAVAGQKDAWADGLYWYTDWPAAAAAARATGRPVLSLRLLGNLTDEYSCANSRFFRTVLYPDPAVAGYLRDHFVLHWQSVRPAPVVTVDYGDGRVVRRTITGNSIHYVLAADGTVVDGLPGLIGPKLFVAELTRAAAAAAHAESLPTADRAANLAGWHARRGRAIDAALAADLARLNLSPAEPLPDATWDRLADLHAADAALSPAAVAMMTVKQMGGPPAALAGRRAITKAVVENPMLRLVGEFRRSLALDTVHNEYDLHRRLHAMLADPAGPPAADVAAVNRRVYAELFLTPDTDPWLGLGPADAYTALPAGGLARADR